ncbi:hypothetical protein JTB14_017624 [Gonioctena quinquepunctata]|nr:hypothetical protein JTB14_017624 [Gonioctena quinquepunctata]
MLNNFRLPRSVWICPDCRSSVDPGNSSTVNSDEKDPEDSRVDNPSLTLKILKNIQSEMQAMKKQYGEVMTAVQFCSDRISDSQIIIEVINIAEWTT